MKVAVALFSSLQLFAALASAHPFVIVNAHVTVAQAIPPTPTHHHVVRQNLLDDLQSAANSLLGISSSSSAASSKKTSSSSSASRTSSSSSSSSSSSATVRTMAPPITASSSTSSARQRVTSTSSSTDDSDDQTSTSSDDSSTHTSTSSSTTSTSTSATLSTSTSSATIPTGNVAQPTASSSPSNNDNNGVPPGGIAVAVIMSLLVVIITAFLVFKYHPKCRAWWAAREAKKFNERSYRDAIDGPGYNLRTHAMGDGQLTRRQTMLKSFFAPATVKLGNGEEIRRKPVNWGVESAHAPSVRSARSASPDLPPLPVDMEKIPVDSEKIPMTAAAAPMGQIERYSYMPQPRPNDKELAPPIPELPAAPQRTLSSAVSPMSMHPREDIERLPPISPLSHRGVPPPDGTERTLPLLPPVPIVPAGLNIAKRGSDGVFRLG